MKKKEVIILGVKMEIRAIFKTSDSDANNK